MISILNSKTKVIYNELGYIHYRPSSSGYMSLINQCFDYYRRSLQSNKLQKDFKNKDGIAKHIIDIFNDKSSKALDIYRHEEITKLVDLLNENNKFCYYTHSKLSFKEPHKETDWYPHQDNAYKKINDHRDGFAILICLEKMNDDNGCLQLFPESHKLKTLKHERIIEDPTYGDAQLKILELPMIDPISITAERGDIILFHNDMIHQSKSSTVNSHRFTLISEIEFSDKIKLDDYGKVPVVAFGSYTLSKKLKIYFLYLINLRNKWLFLKKYFPKLSNYIKRLWLNLNN